MILILVGMYILFSRYKKYIEEKSKQKGYYNYLPRSVAEAFTLAEVLTVLVVVSIIAALTIPSFVNSINEPQYNAGVNKVYSLFSQAVQTLQTNNGTVNIGNAAAGADATVTRTDFCSVMTCVKQDTGSNVFGPVNYKWYKGALMSPFWPGSNTNPSAILNNGTAVMFMSYSTCTNAGVNACGYVHVDINGANGPNMEGQDLFSFWIVLNNGVYSILPLGVAADGFSCVAGGSSWVTTEGCTYQRIINPNKMP